MKTKKDKQKIIQDLVEKFKTASGYLLINLLNLNSQNQFKLKNLLKEKKSFLQVVKKTLIYKANPHFPFKEEELKTPFGFIWSFDSNYEFLSLLKKLKDEGIEIEVLKGYLWQKVFSRKEIEEIINLPSKQELEIRLIANLKNILLRLNNALSSPLKKLVLVMSSIKK